MRFLHVELLEIARLTKTHISAAKAREHEEGDLDSTVLARLFEAMVREFSLFEVTQFRGMQTFLV